MIDTLHPLFFIKILIYYLLTGDEGTGNKGTGDEGTGNKGTGDEQRLSEWGFRGRTESESESS